MAITARATIDQVTATANGDVLIRFERTVVDDALPAEAAVLAQSFHRAAIGADDTFNGVIGGVLEHLAAMGWPEVGEDDLARAKRIARAARTKGARKRK